MASELRAWNGEAIKVSDDRSMSNLSISARVETGMQKPLREDVQKHECMNWN